jgi:hypothetical protein
MVLVHGGPTVQGLAVGVVMLDTRFPRLIGDIGNAATWPFPVAYEVVSGASPERMAQPEPDPGLLDPFLAAAKRLEAAGVRAIASSCGFLAAHQRELADAVSVPVFASALLQVPMAAAAISTEQCVCILTARDVLGERHFNGTGWSADHIRVVQMAPPADCHFIATFVGNATTADPARLEQDIVELSERVRREHPDAGAVVLECANLSPFAHVVRNVTELPVFDLGTLVMHAYLSTATIADRHTWMMSNPLTQA